VERFFQTNPGQAALSLETGTSLAEFSLVAASLTLENDYWILLDILAKGRLNPERVERVGEPLVLVGGVGVWANPWPMIPFADLILLGEAELQWPQIIDFYLDPNFLAESKAGKLRILAAKIPGALVPSLWPEEVLKGEAPLLKPLRPALVAWPPEGFEPPRSPILTPNTEFGQRRLVEISRGCPHGCRFCLAGALYRPHRPWPVAKILAALASPGSSGEPVGLVSPAVADHPEIETLLGALKERGNPISVSSLRLSALTENLARRLLAGGVKGLAVAPEAGSQRLRDVINKSLNEGEILGACQLLAEAGLRKLKLYFMLGLPGETDEDLLAIAGLAQKIQKAIRRGSYAPKLALSVANFSPKSQTPFEAVPLLSEIELSRRGELVRKALAAVGGLELRVDPPLWSIAQSLLARGGVEAGELVRLMWAEGGRVKRFYRRFMAQRSDLGRERAEMLAENPWPATKSRPWRVVAISAGAGFLAAEKELAQTGQLSPPCPPAGHCGRCGACEKMVD
jgi:radical SAM superfamily enzyme YgiQ (UPF0313 family)